MVLGSVLFLVTTFIFFKFLFVFVSMVDRTSAYIYLSELVHEQFPNHPDMAELAMRETFEAHTPRLKHIRSGMGCTPE
jgi:hypothetical protein